MAVTNTVLYQVGDFVSWKKKNPETLKVYKAEPLLPFSGTHVLGR